MAELINERDTLNEGRKKINKAITDADEAKQISEQADIKATEALNKSESTQEQLNQVVIDGDSSVEAAQARVDEKGQSHTTLKERIDDGFIKVNSQLAETEQEIVALQNNKANKNEVNDLANNKADVTYVDSKISNLDGLNVRGAYDTVNSLKNAHPNGANGVFVVKADNHWYYYDGSDWKKGGKYQAVAFTEYMTTDGSDWEVN